MKTPMNRIQYGASCALFLILTGCFGSSNSTTVGDNAVAGDSSQPFTDAFIEYSGPHEKWAGPQTFTVHISTKGEGKAKVFISTSVFKTGSHVNKEIRSVSTDLTVQAAREQFARLYTVLQAKDTPVQGCLSPVKVRLVRADGVLVTRQGCRGQTGWPRVASEITNHMIESSLAMAQANSSPPSGTTHPKPMK
jgi:hypothetical protein